MCIEYFACMLICVPCVFGAVEARRGVMDSSKLPSVCFCLESAGVKGVHSNAWPENKLLTASPLTNPPVFMAIFNSL